MFRAVLAGLALVSGLQPSPAQASPPNEHVAKVIETYLRWAVEGRDLPADPPKATPPFPHRSCGGRLDPANLPRTVYVSWDLSGEAQHASCNWAYDVASHRATMLTPAEAKGVAQRIATGDVGPQERAFFHPVSRRDGRLEVTAGYCWGSATGTFAFRSDGALLTGDLAIHGY